MKFSNYLKVFETPQCLVLYSTLKQRAIKIFDGEIIELVRNIKGGELIDDKNFSKYSTFFETLKESSLVVENLYDESDLVNYMYENSFLQTGILELIILPTRDCNFRCPYCYEEHEKRVMDDDVYTSILDFIEQYINLKPIKTINISWFGGEPLLEHTQIVKFMKKLEEIVGDKCNIIGSMTTNGYLLNQDIFRQLVSCHITNYQITVDGLKEFHDKTRFLSNGSGTWDRIIDNLLKAKGTPLNFRILIRTNYSEELLKNYKEWLGFLKEKFGDDHRFQYHSETVKDLGGENKQLVVDDTQEPLKSVIAEMTKSDMSSFTDRFTNNFCFMCYAGLPYSFVIDYDGSIKKCTVMLDNGIINNVGNIKSGLDIKKLAWWTNYNHKEECRSCFAYPMCFGKKCPSAYFSIETCNKYRNYLSRIISSIIQDI